MTVTTINTIGHLDGGQKTKPKSEAPQMPAIGCARHGIAHERPSAVRS